ncbi:MAG: glycosyltransferase [Caldisericota bacterium]|nr:glycosyltransferase [Caldisericota bacterium]
MIAAVVVTTGRKRELSACIASIRAGTVVPDVIVIVDNGSCTPVCAEEFAPPNPVVIVRSERNTGPAGGAALGQQESMARGADWVWMIDDDAVVCADALAELLHIVGKPNGAGYLRSVVYEQSCPERAFLNAFTYNRRSGLLTRVPESAYLAKVFPFDACSMAGLFLSRALIERIGVFDASLYGWYDDTEYTLRATLAGYQGLAVPASRLLHPTIDRRQVVVLGRRLTVLADKPERVYYGTRNCLVVQRKLLPHWRFWVAFVPVFAIRRFLLILMTYANRRAFLRHFLRGVWDGLQGRTGELVQGGSC